MKLKCKDGVVRNFLVARSDGDYLPDGSRHEGFAEAQCEGCGAMFGSHDTRLMKPIFKAHVCRKT